MDLRYVLITERYRLHQYAAAVARLPWTMEKIVAPVFQGPRGRMLGIASAHLQAVRDGAPVMILDDDVWFKEPVPELDSGCDVLILGSGAYVVFNSEPVIQWLEQWLGMPVGNFWDFKGAKIRWLNIAVKR